MDLMADRMDSLAPELRKQFVQAVLSALIDKTASAALLKTILAIVERWTRAVVVGFVFSVQWRSLRWGLGECSNQCPH